MKLFDKRRMLLQGSAIRLLMMTVFALAWLACSETDTDDRKTVAPDGAISSGGSGVDSTAGTEPTSTDQCRESCEATAKCQGFPLSGCAGDISCSGWPANEWRVEVTSAYMQCIEACPSDLQSCITAAFDAAGEPRAIDNEYATACEEKREACINSFGNNECSEQSLYLESAVNRAMACLEEPCVAASSCIDAAFE